MNVNDNDAEDVEFTNGLHRTVEAFFFLTFMQQLINLAAEALLNIMDVDVTIMQFSQR